MSEDIVERRFNVGLKNFFNLYLPLADSWQMYDNSDVGGPIKTALKMNNKLGIKNQVGWTNLVEQYDEPAKNEDRISRIMNDPEEVGKILTSAINDALLKYKQAGNPVCGFKRWKDFQG